MRCQQLVLPAPEDVDIAALRERYRHERDKRVIREGTDQYIRSTDAFAEVYTADPHTPLAPHIAQKALTRGATMVEPSQEAEDAWVRHIRETAFDMSSFQRECTPSYFNGDDSERPRSYAGEPYGPGWDAFEALLEDWRAKGDLYGLVLSAASASAT